jgi:hypothetical protein
MAVVGHETKRLRDLPRHALGGAEDAARDERRLVVANTFDPGHLELLLIAARASLQPTA